MHTLRVLAVDDEALALRRLELLLEQLPSVELIATARNGRQALDRIHELRPDVILLDIKMGAIGGFEVVESLAGPDAPLVIFVTAFDEFAARGFEVSAVDYVLKPVRRERLEEALEKARGKLDASSAESRIAELRTIVAALREGRGSAGERDEIWAQRRGHFVRLLVDDIEWIEAERDYVHLHVGNESYMLRETLVGIHERLGGGSRFIRIRRSALVHAAKLVAVKRCGYGDFRVLLASGDQLRVGRTYVKGVREMISHGPATG